MVEMNDQTTFGDKKFLKLYIKFEALAASLQNSLPLQWPCKFWCKFVWFYCLQFEISQADSKNKQCIHVLEKTIIKDNREQTKIKDKEDNNKALNIPPKSQTFNISSFFILPFPWMIQSFTSMPTVAFGEQNSDRLHFISCCNSVVFPLPVFPTIMSFILL